MKTTDYKTGKTGLLLTALLLTVTFFAAAQNPYPPYDFKQANADGDTLYYRITSNTNPFTVAVTRC
ncbi:MAG: hypothetical protein IKR77_03620 [Bacteroidales bacterium]|nr:hypothetical protein [Bacteroidales bacterium]